MTTGKDRIDPGLALFLRVAVCCCVILTSQVCRAGEGVPPAPPGEGNPWTIGRLATRLSQVSERRAGFVETHHSGLLTKPVETKGELIFTAPSKLEKIVSAPFEERYLVDGDTLTVERRAKGIKKTVPLDEYPSLRAFVEAFRAVLAGDLKTLQRFYDVRLDGVQSGWVLTLAPRDPAMRERITSITLSGSDAAITSFDIRQSNGDGSRMVITGREE